MLGMQARMSHSPPCSESCLALRINQHASQLIGRRWAGMNGAATCVLPDPTQCRSQVDEMSVNDVDVDMASLVWVQRRYAICFDQVCSTACTTRQNVSDLMPRSRMLVKLVLCNGCLAWFCTWPLCALDCSTLHNEY
jgi:hypothetical protein